MEHINERKPNFLRDNSYEIVKLFINQIGITIFSLVLYTAAASIEDKALYSKVVVILSVFAVVFYFALLYTAAWDFGAKDKIKIDSGKLKGSSFCGLKMSLVANIPNFVIALVAALFMGLYILNGNEAFYTVFGVFNLIIRFISAMFLGVIQGIFAFLDTSDVESRQYLVYHFWQAVAYFIAPVFTIAVTHVGYVFGLKNKKIFGFVGAKKKDK